jgi:TetR/AcrR family transcriptional regulator, cholesterol catabolism regulator
VGEVAVTDERGSPQLDRRRRVIDVAFELGAEGGYDAVQMREVAATANVALATIYRYFSSKDHLLAAAMTEWTSRLRNRVAQSPPKGDTMADQLVDVLHRACKAMERQPKLSMALIRSLSSADPGVNESGTAMQHEIALMGDEILQGLDAELRNDILRVIGHVWYSSLITWANGRRDFESVITELDRAVHVLVDPHEQPQIERSLPSQ